MSRIKKLSAMTLAGCMALSSVAAYAELATLATTPVEATGTVSGDVEAAGRYYADYSSLEEALEAGNRLHVRMTQEGQVLLKNENGALPLSADERNVTFLGIGSEDYVRGGGGSGASTGTSYKLDWYQGFEQEGFHINPKTQELLQQVRHQHVRFLQRCGDRVHQPFRSREYGPQDQQRRWSQRPERPLSPAGRQRA